jgi:hypothetical protein
MALARLLAQEAMLVQAKFAALYRLFGPPEWIDPGLPYLALIDQHRDELDQEVAIYESLWSHAAPHIVVWFAGEDPNAESNRTPEPQDAAHGNLLVHPDPELYTINLPFDDTPESSAPGTPTLEACSQVRYWGMPEDIDPDDILYDSAVDIDWSTMHVPVDYLHIDEDDEPLPKLPTSWSLPSMTT